jgi:D-alanine-D-alanine ligase-like ATP-grasp enzyme
MNQNKKKRKSLYRTVQDIAKDMGASVIAEPTYKKMVCITFQNGKTIYYHKEGANINISSAIKVCVNKYETKQFLKLKSQNSTILQKLKVPEGESFSDSKYDKISKKAKLEKKGIYIDITDFSRNSIHEYAQKILGFPVILKPNTGEQAKHVYIAYNTEDVKLYLKKFPKTQRGKTLSILAEKYYEDYKNYRIAVLNNEVISAYENIPLSVTGSGKDTIHELLKAKRKSFKHEGLRPENEIADDFRIQQYLKKFGMNMDTVIPEHEAVNLLGIANLCTGGEAIDKTNDVSNYFKEQAIEIARALNLFLCGIDILTKDITGGRCEYIVLEVNSNPGLDNYKNNIEALYAKILKNLELR